MANTIFYKFSEYYQKEDLSSLNDDFKFSTVDIDKYQKTIKNLLNDIQKNKNHFDINLSDIQKIKKKKKFIKSYCNSFNEKIIFPINQYNIIQNPSK